MKSSSVAPLTFRRRSQRRLAAIFVGFLASHLAAVPGKAQGTGNNGATVQNLSNGSYLSAGGTLTLSGGLNVGNGALVLSGGTLVLNGTLSPSTITLVPASGTLVLSGTLTTPSGSITIPGGSFSLNGTLTASNPPLAFLGGTALATGLLTLNGGGVYQPQISASLGQPFLLLKCVSVGAGSTPTVCSAAGLPAGLTIDPGTGVISGTPLVLGTFRFDRVTANDKIRVTEPLELTVTPLPFFANQASLGSGVYYTAFPGGGSFGEYSYLSDPRYVYSWDLSSYEFVLDANNGGGIYLYDFASGGWFYTSPTYPYPYVYDFERNAVLYYYQGTASPRYFYDFGSRQIISK